MKEDKQEARDPFDGDYIGNIWGWKFSFIGLGMILFFVLLMWYRYATLDPDRPGTSPMEEVRADSLNAEGLAPVE
ncbi:MAG: hypothetical protein KDC30_15330 [Saprospiraceae bacterium]|nr:hypothetical protein [Saprospiraceae bacterium]